MLTGLGGVVALAAWAGVYLEQLNAKKMRSPWMEDRLVLYFADRARAGLARVAPWAGPR